MYGIVNRAIEELIVEKFGEAKWEIVKEKAVVNGTVVPRTKPLA
jgi:hypothetical protein